MRAGSLFVVVNWRSCSKAEDVHEISTAAVDLWTELPKVASKSWISRLWASLGAGNLRLARRGHSGLGTEITSKVQSPGELLRAFRCLPFSWAR